MAILLVRPFYDTHIITPPLGLGYLSSYLQKRGIETKIIDAVRDNLTADVLVDRILQEQPEAVGIMCMTCYYDTVVSLCRKLKSYGVRVILGGVHPTVLPRATLRDSQCDFLIAGEGEMALAELVERRFDPRGISGVYTADNIDTIDDDNVVKAKPIDCLDDIPFPDWAQMSPSSYPYAPHGAIARNYPIGVVVTSRGCPYECTFCASPKLCGRRIRFRSPRNVIDEVHYLVDNYGVKEIHFEDDNLTLKRSHIEEICRLLIAEEIQISWACPNGIRADKVDAELISLMKRSGCYYFAFGVESANAQILRNIKKQESLATINDSIKMARKAGICCQGFFVFGLPGETAETLVETIHFASSSNLSRAQFLILDVLPGCELWDTLDGQFCPNWSKDSFREPEWLPSGMTRNQLVRAQICAFRKFYFANPGRLFRLATSVRPSQVKYLMKRLLDYRIIGSTGATAARPTIMFPSVSAETPRGEDVSRAA
ncbi:MAG: radical SAM protein [Thermoguttaceae bacterium]|jgi:radical SAM superfamily enzyme YgiQ (UPF0313 family)